MRTSLYILVFVFISSCTTGVKMRTVNYGPLLNDLNSKIWIVDQVFKNGKNLAPRINLDKDLIIFYKSGKCLFQPMNTLGDFVGKRGEYSVYSDEKLLTLYFGSEKWDFKILEINPDKVIINPTEKSDIQYKMVLKPFPEI